MVAEIMPVASPNVAPVLAETAPRPTTAARRLFIYGRRADVRQGHESADGDPDSIVRVVTVMCDAVGEGSLLVTCHPARIEPWLAAIHQVEPDADLNVVADAAALSASHRWTVVNSERADEFEADLLAQPWAGVAVDDAPPIDDPSRPALRLLPDPIAQTTVRQRAVRRTWRSVTRIDEAVNALETRAFAYLRRNPARGGSTWAAFLDQLEQARTAAALAKVPATLALVHERLRTDGQIVVVTDSPDVATLIRGSIGAAAVSLTTDDTAEQRHRAIDAFARDPAVRVLVAAANAVGAVASQPVVDHLIFHDLSWTPATHRRIEQLLAQGSSAEMLGVTFVTAPDTLDRFIAARLQQQSIDSERACDVPTNDASLLRIVVEAALWERECGACSA